MMTHFAQGTALYELYLSIQQRALRAFHDPGTWGGLGSGDVLSMLTMAGEHLQVLMETPVIVLVKFVPIPSGSQICSP